jgi:hypothetical protein
MTEIDVDMAIHAMSQAVEDLLAAARDKDGRQHVAANRQRLIDEVGRLYDSLAGARARPGQAAPGRARTLPSPPQRRVA